jgi:hypothetical protein
VRRNSHRSARLNGKGGKQFYEYRPKKIMQQKTIALKTFAVRGIQKWGKPT